MALEGIFMKSLQFLLILSISTTLAEPPKSLRMVHYLFRHGDRSPVQSYPGDPNPPAVWTKGWGQLTTIGMRQHNALGRYMRQRYDGFISRNYYNKEVVVRSTDVDRTLMSAYSHLSGLYVPEGEDVWNASTLWQPIPVHTVPEHLDTVLAINDCPRQDQLRKEAWQLPYFVEIANREQAFISWISQKVGKVYDITTMYKLNDPIFIEHLKNMKLPDYADQEVLDKLLYMDMLTFKAETYTRELQRVTGGGGPLVKDLIDRLKLKISGRLDPDLKLYIYSAHDSTVSAFLQTLNVFNDLCPPYTATVLMELHEDGGQYYLEFSYKNDTNNEPFLLNLPGCGIRCPFDKFVQMMDDVMPDDVKAECQLASHYLAKHIQVIVYCAVGTVSVIIVILQICVIVLLRRRQRYNAYRPVTQM